MKYSPPIVEETLDSYCFGTAAGASSFLLKGIYSSPNGKRFDTGLQSAYKMGPKVAGFATVVTAVFCTVDHTMEYVRQKNDLWNKVAAGAASAGLLAIRRGGLGFGSRSVVLCGSLAGIVFATT